MSSELEKRIKTALREVLLEMGLDAPQAPTEPRVLFVVHGNSPCQNKAFEQIQAIQHLAGKTSMFLNGAARLCLDEREVKEQTGTRCLLGDVPPEALDRVLDRADWLVAPTLPLTVAARAAHLGVPDYCPIQEALLRGKKVLAAQDAFRHPGVMPRPGLEEGIRQVMKTLESYGVILAPVARLSQVFGQALRPQAPAPAVDPAAPDAAVSTGEEPKGEALAYVSARDVRRAVDEGKKFVRLQAGGLVGPLAKDLARDSGIKIS